MEKFKLKSYASYVINLVLKAIAVIQRNFCVVQGTLGGLHDINGTESKEFKHIRIKYLGQ